MCEKHTAGNFIFILLLEFQFFYRFFAMGVFIVETSTVPAATLIPRFLNSNILSVLLFVNPKLCTIIADWMNYLL